MSGTTYASMSFRAILNQVLQKIGLDFFGLQACFTKDWKHQVTLTFYETDQPDAPPIFDICSDVCHNYSEAVLSALAHTLSYFNGVLRLDHWRLSA
jgi:hypothetical protein